MLGSTTAVFRSPVRDGTTPESEDRRFRGPRGDVGSEMKGKWDFLQKCLIVRTRELTERGQRKVLGSLYPVERSPADPTLLDTSLVKPVTV